MNDYVPRIDDRVHVTSAGRFGHLDMVGTVVCVIHMGALPDAAEMDRLFAKNIERRNGKRSGLGIPCKMSSYPRILIQGGNGFVRCVTMDGQHRIRLLVRKIS